MDWESWIGPAQMRPYKKGVYHSFNWRGWYDFGTGALGDMACHMVNMPFRALKLGYANVIECEETSQLFPETFPQDLPHPLRVPRARRPAAAQVLVV